MCGGTDGRALMRYEIRTGKSGRITCVECAKILNRTEKIVDIHGRQHEHLAGYRKDRTDLGFD